MENKFENLITEIKNIFPNSKKFVPLLERNIYGNTYRGKHNIQQERKSIKQLAIILKEFYNITKNDNFEMAIAPGDVIPNLSIPSNNKYENYVTLVNNLNMNIEYLSERLNKSEVNNQYKTLKKQTLKNLFDFGAFFTKWKVLSKGQIKVIKPGESAKGRATTYLRLKHELILAIENGDKTLYTYISKNIKRFFMESSNILINFLLDEHVRVAGIKRVKNTMYALTLSYYGLENKNGKRNGFDEVRDAYLELHFSKTKVNELETLLKKYSNKTKKNDKGNGQFDWGNFKNQVDSLYKYLSLTSTFELGKDGYISYKLFENNPEEMPKRSAEAKREYFEKHKISKNKYPKFELHHSYPLALAETPDEFKLIDDWKNLIFISPNGHAEFPKRNNTFTLIKKLTKEEITYSSIVENDDKKFINGKDVAFDERNSNAVIEYNKMLNDM